MPMSKTRRTINVLIYVAIIGFVAHFADQASAHFYRASDAMDQIQAR